MLTECLIRIFVRNPGEVKHPPVRLAYGELAGSVGIAVNLLLCSIKLAIGLLSGSVAVAADAFNNLSDAGSAVVTLVGFKLAAKPADNEHPFGHGRLEYVAGLVVAVIIIAVGLNFLKESAVRIWSPTEVRMDYTLIGILAGTLVFKVWLFFFYRTIGRRIDSTVVGAAAFDSLSDLATTSLVVVSMIVSQYTRFPVDGCAGVVVALLVLVGGWEILRDTVNPLLGECPDRTLVEEMRTRLLQCPGICGIHDIIIHNYGPDRYFATAHAEVDQTGDLQHMHDALEAAEVTIAETMPIRLILHCDPCNETDPTVKKWRVWTEEAVASLDTNFKVYDFRISDGPEPDGVLKLHFHLLIPRNYALNGEEIRERLTRDLRQYGTKVELHIDYIHAFV